MNKVRKGLRIAGDVWDNPDEKFNSNALSGVSGLIIKNVWGVNVQQPGSIQGIKHSPFTGICLYNVKLSTSGSQEVPWKCTDVSGPALVVQPGPCS